MRVLHRLFFGAVLITRLVGESVAVLCAGHAGGSPPARSVRRYEPVGGRIKS